MSAYHLHCAVFQEESHNDYDFALGGDMTADAFAQVVRGKRRGVAPPPPPQAGGPSGTPSSSVQPAAGRPAPEVAPFLAQGRYKRH